MSLRLWTAILGGLQILTASADLIDVIGRRPALIVILAIGALQAGTAIYMRGGSSTSPAVLAETLYNAYGVRAGWRTHQGHPMPSWEELPEGMRASWAAAARAALRNV